MVYIVPHNFIVPHNLVVPSDSDGIVSELDPSSSTTTSSSSSMTRMLHPFTGTLPCFAGAYADVFSMITSRYADIE